MTCRHAQSLISAYLDCQLTGRQMLEMEQHLESCDACNDEYLAVRQVKYLLRSLADKGPISPLDTETIAQRATVGLSAVPALIPNVIVPRWTPRMRRIQRGRRLALAMALSCLAVLSVALPFAPSTVDVDSSGLSTLSPLADSTLLAPTPVVDIRASALAPDAVMHRGTVTVDPWIAATGHDARRDAAVAGPYIPPTHSLDAEPLSDEGFRNYVNSARDVTMAGFTGR